jgi:hypothetical protein
MTEKINLSDFAAFLFVGAHDVETSREGQALRGSAFARGTRRELASLLAGLIIHSPEFMSALIEAVEAIQDGRIISGGLECDTCPIAPLCDRAEKKGEGEPCSPNVNTTGRA